MRGDAGPRFPSLGSVKEFLQQIAAAQPLPWGDRQGPPRHTRTAVGVYTWGENDKWWEVLYNRAKDLPRGIERFLVDIRHNRISL